MEGRHTQASAMKKERRLSLCEQLESLQQLVTMNCLRVRVRVRVRVRGRVRVRVMVRVGVRVPSCFHLRRGQGPQWCNPDPC